MKRPRHYVETQIQKAIVTHLRTVLRGSAMVLHIANNPRSARDGQRLKALGLVAGAPDLLVLLPDGLGVFLEVKNEGEYLRESQKAFKTRCAELGWPYAVVRSIEDVRETFANLGIETKEAA